jgi:YidC/Oxa1 family membrane protein insertase
LEEVECKKEAVAVDTLDGKIGWVGLRNKYFFIGLAPQDGKEYTVEVGRQLRIGGDKHYDVSMSWKIGDGVHARHILLYTGPLVYQRLLEYQLGLERAVDLGWWVIRPFGQGIMWLFAHVHKVIPNYGVVLIFFALLIKIIVYPLTRKSYISSLKMQELQPSLAALKEKYKDDQARMGQETMKLYKEAGVNPAGGCLPLVLQMPIFFALYKVFSSTIELRRAHFFWWLKDLSQPDPYYVLPVLMGVSMFIQQKMTVTDPKQAMMVYLMPGIMMFFFLKVSSGLVLYWTMFNILSILQQEFIDKKIYRPQLSR